MIVGEQMNIFDVEMKEILDTEAKEETASLNERTNDTSMLRNTKSRTFIL